MRTIRGNPIDTLIETQDTDLGLYGNIFITGQVMNDSGTQGYAAAAGGYVSEQQMQEDMQTAEDPGAAGDATFRQPGYAEVWQRATVESITGIFSTAILTGGTGNNTIVVNSVDGKISVAGQGALTVTPWNGEAILDNGANSVDQLPEYYVVTNAAGSTAKVDIIDSGGASGTDDLIVFGSNQADTLALNAAGSGASAVMFITATVTSSESISARGVDRLEIYTLGGDDHLLSNDTSVTTIVNLGAGDDSIVVGTVPLIPDPGNRTLQYPNGVPVADTAHMTNGNTAPLYVLGGTQDDYFEVDHNVGMLYLAGDAGDDTFLINTFLELKQNPGKPDEITNLTTLFGGTGSNRYEYVQNAPVVINGGSGYDTIIIDGTPIDDTFIITDTYVAGAGRIVTFTNIEAIEVDGSGGNDDIWVLATNPALTVTVNGGGGDDTIHIGGTPPPLVYAPPAYTYTPPAYTVSTTTVETTSTTIAYGDFFVGYSIFNWSFWGIALGLYTQTSDPITSLLHAIFGADATINFGSLNVYYAWYWWNIFDPYVLIDVSNVTVTYTTKSYVTTTTLIQPPPVTITPAPVIVDAAGVDASQVRSKLVIEGGDDFQTSGDTVIYENENSTAPETGELVQRSEPKMEETGEDPVTGNPIFTPDTTIDPATGVPYVTTYLSLESTGLGINPTIGQTDVEGNKYYGIELEGIEHVELKLSNAGGNFTINDNALCTGAMTKNGSGQVQAVTACGAGNTIKAPTVDVYGGTSADTFTVDGIGAETTIVGGGGNDSTVVQAHAGSLSGILSQLIVDGVNALQTTSATITSDPNANTYYKNLPNSDLVDYFLGANLMVVQQDPASGTSLPTIDGVPYYQGVSTSVLCMVGGTLSDGTTVAGTCPNTAELPAGAKPGDIEIEAGVIDDATIGDNVNTAVAQAAKTIVSSGLVDAGISVWDPVSATVAGVSIRISKGYVDGDTLSVSLSVLHTTSIGASYADGTLTLTGIDSLQDYINVLRTLQFTPGAGGISTTNTREITWAVGSGNLVQVNVQEKGVLEKGQPVYAQTSCASLIGTTCIAKDSSGNLLDDVSYTTSNKAQVYLDANNNETLTVTATPKIAPAGTYNDGRPTYQVYVDPTFGESFSSTGQNLVTNGDFSQAVPNNAAGNGWASSNMSGSGAVNGTFVLDSGPGVTPTISQQITGLIPGAIYQLSFSYQDPGNLDPVRLELQRDHQWLQRLVRCGQRHLQLRRLRE